MVPPHVAAVSIAIIMVMGLGYFAAAFVLLPGRRALAIVSMSLSVLLINMAAIQLYKLGERVGVSSCLPCASPASMRSF